MFKRSFNPHLVVVCLIVIAATIAPTRAQILNTANIDQLCKSSPEITYRRTVVYVDLAAVTTSKTEWGLTILNRLELAPRERLTLLATNPNTFEVDEVFDSCLPTFTTEEADSLRKNRNLWDRLTTSDPTDQQRENLQTFDARIRNALDKIIDYSRKYVRGERQNTLGAIALDKNRYSDEKAVFRLIVYTDGVIREPGLPDSASEDQIASALLKEYSATFAGANAYVFGIAAETEAVQRRERTFSAFFLKNWGNLQSFSSALPQQEGQVYPAALRMSGSFEGGGSQGAVAISLFAPKHNDPTTGWLAFNTGREMVYVPFKGTYKCDDHEQCALNATCSKSVPMDSPAPYFRSGDRILLQGKPGQLDGTLQADSKEVFKDDKQRVQYSLKFTK